MNTSKGLQATAPGLAFYREVVWSLLSLLGAMIRFYKMRKLFCFGLSIAALISVIALLEDILSYYRLQGGLKVMNAEVETPHGKNKFMLQLKTIKPSPHVALTTSSNGHVVKLQGSMTNSRQKTTNQRLQAGARARVQQINPRTLYGEMNGSVVFPCITSEIENMKFPICTYSSVEDFVVSGTFLNNGYFEADVVSKILRELRADDSIQFVDIGANIGTYTLPVSRLRKVLSVEPNWESMKRLATSVVQGEVFDNVDLVFNAVSSRRTTVRLAYDRMNRGDSFLLSNSDGCNDSSYMKHMVKCADQPVETILLDDLVALMSKKRAVIKIDVQGHEIDVFTEPTAAIFFDEIDVPLVFMEWEEYVSAASVNIKDETKSSDVDTLLSFFYKRHYAVYDTDYRKLPGNWTVWPNNIILRKE